MFKKNASIYMFLLKLVMSSGSHSDQSVSKRNEKRSLRCLIHGIERDPGCLKKLQNLKEILTNHTFNINNIPDAIPSLN